MGLNIENRRSIKRDQGIGKGLSGERENAMGTRKHFRPKIPLPHHLPHPLPHFLPHHLPHFLPHPLPRPLPLPGALPPLADLPPLPGFIPPFRFRDPFVTDSSTSTTSEP
ncbi:uncharacterized protein [Physcomitrium patens]|uniref:Uncharacterized protein n=1 Tax=Physcomitrium patens TaxID=3218 RepID=A0A2K1J050_PHYPA|nr:hypothetical protein PHYPA_022804 [Physcomitrium patens]